MLKSKFEDLKPYFEKNNILITTHDAVDLDGFVSSYLLNIFLKNSFKKEIFLIFPEFSKSTREFIKKLSKKYIDIPNTFPNDFDISKIDLILILDTNNLELINLLKKEDILNYNIPYIFIDHHLDLKQNNKNNITSLNIISEDFSSTSEIIFELMKFFKFQLQQSHKFLLLAAILIDSGFLKYSNNKTIMNISNLIDDQLSIQEIISALDFKSDISERIAKIKALQRLEIIRVKNWLIGITHVSSYEARVASNLIRSGCDIAIVYSKKKKEFRITTRVKKHICIETGLHLGKILEECSNQCQGTGGGHDGAASLNGKINLNEILNKIIEKIKQILNQ